MEWPGNTGSAGGLGMSRRVALGRTGVEAHLTSVGPLRCETREGNQPCAQVRLKGYTESPIMGASFLGGSHWASSSEVTREAPSMTGLHAADTENADSWLVDVLFVGWTAERTATWTKYQRDRGTCYAATSCTKGALPGEDLECFAFYYPRCKGTGAFQMYWK